jgi:hypothetical protein
LISDRLQRHYSKNRQLSYAACKPGDLPFVNLAAVSDRYDFDSQNIFMD